jgi:hypothetical protein
MHFSFLSVRNEQACPLLNDAAETRVRQPSQFYDQLLWPVRALAD